jgi:hypothetical protein
MWLSAALQRRDTPRIQDLKRERVLRVSYSIFVLWGLAERQDGARLFHYNQNSLSK